LFEVFFVLGWCMQNATHVADVCPQAGVLKRSCFAQYKSESFAGLFFCSVETRCLNPRWLARQFKFPFLYHVSLFLCHLSPLTPFISIAELRCNMGRNNLVFFAVTGYSFTVIIKTSAWMMRGWLHPILWINQSGEHLQFQVGWKSPTVTTHWRATGNVTAVH
jgi:hypothetical protein